MHFTRSWGCSSRCQGPQQHYDLPVGQKDIHPCLAQHHKQGPGYHIHQGDRHGLSVGQEYTFQAIFIHLKTALLSVQIAADQTTVSPIDTADI